MLFAQQRHQARTCQRPKRALGSYKEHAEEQGSIWRLGTGNTSGLLEGLQPEIDISKVLYDEAALCIEASKAAKVKKWEDLKVAYEKAIAEGSVSPVFDKSLLATINAQKRENSVVDADTEQDDAAEHGEGNPLYSTIIPFAD